MCMVLYVYYVHLCAFDLYILVPLSLKYTVHVHWLRKGGPDGLRS